MASWREKIQQGIGEELRPTYKRPTLSGAKEKGLSLEAFSQKNPTAGPQKRNPEMENYKAVADANKSARPKPRPSDLNVADNTKRPVAIPKPISMDVPAPKAKGNTGVSKADVPVPRAKPVRSAPAKNAMQAPPKRVTAKAAGMTGYERSQAQKNMTNKGVRVMGAKTKRLTSKD